MNDKFDYQGKRPDQVSTSEKIALLGYIGMIVTILILVVIALIK